ncbi:mitochondrial ubiquitin ligase activator of NFKB 1 isoform X1 [Pseudonaja textilis]|uniref:mitochondrial ubiquitin ligase activator of NFKB 1 isoform X1 n=2 Tax=Pseudonaja textilis TaxID=8673 RepID=UPI000EA905EA|nr:mitochondrial ubiquitin ligase activator of NFKB 1 isoform X1 [Pseudonaja textilis]
MSRKQAARTRPGKAEVERKRDERAARRALARERRNRAQGEGEHGGGGLNEQLRALGLRLREVPGDGNCLFRALGDQLEGHSRNHLKHRQDTVAYMIQQRPDFEPFVEDDVPFEKHTANLAQPGTFAGNDAIVAFARNNQVNIVIHQQNAPLWQIHGTDKSNARELHIAYRYGEHYDSVRKINDNSAAPAWLQMEMLCQNESPNQEALQAKGERQPQPKEESQDEMDDALQKVHNATGCSDVGLIAQVLEAEGYSIESTIFALFQMKDLENLRTTMDSASHTSTREIILLATSSAVTAILYAVYRHKSKIADSLKGAKKVTLDQDLRNLLIEAPGKCVPYAVIEGVVRSVKESLNSQFVDSCKGVVQRLTLQEHKMVWNRTTHFWNNYEKIIHQRTNTVPFDLVPPGSEVPPSVAVRVLKPLTAAELSLETVYERFHPSVQSLTDAIGHYISGERPKGIKETEEMLTVGAALTGVGELVLDSGTIKLQPPKQGLRYCLSSLGFDTLLKRQESSVRFWKILTTLCGLASCALLIFILHKQYRCQREKRQLRQMLEGLTAGGDATNACVVCLGNSRACVFLECGHVCSCLKCYEALPRPPRCPICRQLITRVVPLYNS